MNVLFLNRSFHPDCEATGQFLTELCEDLTNYGHKVTVICGRSYHPGDRKFNFHLQFDKYKKVEIIRGWGTKFSKRFLLLRLLNLGTYFLLAFASGFFVRKKPDVIIAQTDPPLLGLLGIFFSVWYRSKFIYSCKDIYPEVGIVTGKLKNPLLNCLLKVVNLFSFKMANIVLCLGEDMKQIIESKGVRKEKIIVINDWVDTNEIYPVKAIENEFIKKNGLDGKFIVMHSGNIGFTQGLDQFIDIINYFNNNNDIKFLFIGDGVDKVNLQEIANSKNLTNLTFLPYQPKEDLKYSLSAGDLHVITLKKGLKGIIVPSKVYGILACAKPFVAWIDKGSEIDYIASKFNCGLIVAPGDVESMIHAIKWAMANKNKLQAIGESGRKAAVENYDRKISTEKFNKVLLNLKK